MELELSKGKQNFHSTPSLKSGRAAFQFILDFAKPANVYIPFYTCDSLLEPLKKANIPFQFYEINEHLEPAQLPELKKGELYLYIDYFDLKRNVVEMLSEKYASQLIVDCSQAFFLRSNGKSWYFNSCRKFFGVPDGAYLYAPDRVNIEIKAEKNINYTIQHLIKRFNGEVKEGYSFYLENEKLCNSEIKCSSQLTENLLSHVDYNLCIETRRMNFNTLHASLKKYNRFNFEVVVDAVPMAYPFLPNKSVNHQQLWNQDLFVPFLWTDVIKRPATNFDFEKSFSANLIPIPIDQRYSQKDMAYIIEKVQS